MRNRNPVDYEAWTPEVQAIYDRAYADIAAIIDGELRKTCREGFVPEDAFTALHQGPIHQVWEDGNLDAADPSECDSAYYSEWLPGVLDVLRRCCRELNALEPARLWR